MALEAYGRAHELRDNGHEKEAFVGAVTALDIGIEEYLKRKIRRHPREAKELAKKLLSLPLRTQVVILITTASIAPIESLEHVIQAIDTRNDIVHDEKEPADPDWKLFLSIKACLIGLLELEDIKSPVLYPSNSLSPTEYGGNEAVEIGR